LIICPAASSAGDLAATYKAYRAPVQFGSEYLQKGDHQRAISYLTKAIEMSPFEAMEYFNRDLAFYKSGKMKGAEEDIDKTLILDPRMVNLQAVFLNIASFTCSPRMSLCFSRSTGRGQVLLTIQSLYGNTFICSNWSQGFL